MHSCYVRPITGDAMNAALIALQKARLRARSKAGIRPDAPLFMMATACERASAVDGVSPYRATSMAANSPSRQKPLESAHILMFGGARQGRGRRRLRPPVGLRCHTAQGAAAAWAPGAAGTRC